MSRPIIALTTDFGQADTYVGTMKGVILGICPQAALVDVTHEVRPQALHQASFLLHNATPYFPPGTIHMVVIDPGVGSERRPIVVKTQRAIYVAPDNGVLTMALARDPARTAIHLTEARYWLPQPSATFHGRDLFAPAAAYLACGIKPCEMGKEIPLDSLISLPPLQPRILADGEWRGEILHVDHFGNLVTNIQRMEEPTSLHVEVTGTKIAGVSETFSDRPPGEMVAYIGSSGYLEIAVRNGNAAEQLSMDVGSSVTIKRVPVT
jgi:S-adenosylmethionine hydrolase